MDSLFSVRDLKEQDRACIVETWWRSLRDRPSFMENIPRGIMRKYMSLLINEILDKALCKVVVDANDEDVIVGYMVYETRIPVIHYVYIKAPFQKLGIAKDLLKIQADNITNEVVIISHITKKFESAFMKEHPTGKKYIYNPYIIKELGYEN